MERTLLKQARKRKNLTQQKVADHLKIKQPHYCKMELGIRNISLEQGKLLSKLLKINIKDL